MTKLVLIDWLGRGGIPQTTEAWRRVATNAGLAPVVVARAGVDLKPDVSAASGLPGRIGSLVGHARLVSQAVATIHELRPEVVYVQHYWVPLLESRVVAAAHQVGSRVVLALHNHRPHSIVAGTQIGLASYVRSVDDVVVHSHFVGDHIARSLGRCALVVEHPLPLGLLETRIGRDRRRSTSGAPRAVHFGVLRRRYKGGDLVRQIAQQVEPEWTVVSAGLGAGSPSANLETIDRFLMPAELVDVVAQSDVAVLPYRAASQSGAVVLAQALGVPPIASAVGGIPEQIDHERTGLLVAPSASSAEWARLLRDLARDRGAILELGRAAREHVHAAHAEAVANWLAVVT